MGLLDRTYLKGITSALNDAGVVKVASLDTVAFLAEQGLKDKFHKVAMGGLEGMPPQGMPGAQPSQPPSPDQGGQTSPDQGGQASPEELAQVTNSGISEGDIQAAAKVIQMVAEMKQQADQSGMAVQPPMGGGQPPAPMGGGQPPMPPAPKPPMGGGGQPPMQ